jgi:MFS family permease
LLIPLTMRGFGLVLFVLGSVTIYVVFLVGNVIWGSWAQAYYPPHMRGRISGSIGFFAYGVAPIGALVAGLIASQYGVRNALWVMLGILAVSSLVQLTGPLARMRDLPMPSTSDNEPVAPAEATATSSTSGNEA